MPKDTTAIGNSAESIAASYLESLGYKVIARNHRTKFAELDIVAVDKEYLLFVEVKYRKSAEFGGGSGAVTADKLRRLSNASSMWLAEHDEFEALQPRIDVIVVEGDLSRPSIHHIENVSIDI